MDGLFRLTVTAVVARPRCAGLQVPQVRSVRRQSRSHCCCFTPDSQYIDKVVDVPVVFRMPVVASNRCRDGLWVFLGPCTQVHGQVSPAIRAGKGWRGRRELAPRCSATQLGALRRVAGQTPSCLNHPYHHHHHHQPFHSNRSILFALNCCGTPAVATSERGAAVRRREHWLRALHRHERMTVAAELATALHHVEAPREGVELEKNVGLRAQKPSLQGKRPGLPPEPEPLGRAVHQPFLLIVLPSLCGLCWNARGCHERPRWGLLRVAEEGATAAFDAPARTADRRNGAGCSPSSQP